MSGSLMIGRSGTDFVTHGQPREVSENHTLHLSVQPNQGLSLLLTSPERLSRGQRVKREPRSRLSCGRRVDRITLTPASSQTLS